MNSPDKNLLKESFQKIRSIMSEQSVKKITIQRQYLPEIFDDELLDIYEGLPIIKPYFVNYFRAGGLLVTISNKEIRFVEISPENLKEVLLRIIESNPEVKAASIVSAEGLPIASVLPRGVDDTKLSAMSVALLSLAKFAVAEMKKGDFEQLFIRGNEGYLLVLQAGPNAVLTLSTTNEAKLGLILFEYDRNFKRFFVELSSEDDISEKEKIRCKNCGAEIPRDQLACQSCGKKIE
jgi:predicted regulator of Ras-like GTPase activity (Roadblock/LC7/MglB family)